MKHIRTNVTKLRFNDEELAILDKAAEKLGVNRARFMREALLQKIDSILNENEKPTVSPSSDTSTSL
jgi:uncharacterized protein (DUF1778 family)